MAFGLLRLPIVLPGGGQAIAVTTFSTSPVAMTVLPGSTAPASALIEHDGAVKPPPSGTAGDGNEQADTLKQPTAVQSNDLSNFIFCIDTPGSLEMISRIRKFFLTNELR
jgi:hypothetical protein